MEDSDALGPKELRLGVGYRTIARAARGLGAMSQICEGNQSPGGRRTADTTSAVRRPGLAGEQALRQAEQAERRVERLIGRDRPSRAAALQDRLAEHAGPFPDLTLARVRRRVVPPPVMGQRTANMPGPMSQSAAAEWQLMMGGGQPVNAPMKGQLTVDSFIKTYHRPDGSAVRAGETVRLEGLAWKALSICEQLLGPALESSSVDLGSLEVEVDLDLGAMSDGEMAERWGQAMAQAIREQIR